MARKPARLANGPATYFRGIRKISIFLASEVVFGYSKTGLREGCKTVLPAKKPLLCKKPSSKRKTAEAYLIDRDMAAQKDKSDKKPAKLTEDDEIILRAAKEIVIKFIETGRVSPTNFDETFQKVYSSVRSTVFESS